MTSMLEWLNKQGDLRVIPKGQLAIYRCKRCGGDVATTQSGATVKGGCLGTVKGNPCRSGGVVLVDPVLVN